MDRSLGMFSSGFLPFLLSQISFHHFSTLIWFVSFHPLLWLCVRRDRPASLLFTDLQWRCFMASHNSSRPCVRHFYIYLKGEDCRVSHIRRNHLLASLRDVYRVGLAQLSRHGPACFPELCKITSKISRRCLPLFTVCIQIGFFLLLEKPGTFWTRHFKHSTNFDCWSCFKKTSHTCNVYR